MPLSAFHRIRRDEGAQGLVFAAFTLFVLACTLGYVSNIAAAIDAKIEAQGAVDAAAYSAAAVQANLLALVAAVNNVMIQLYRAIAVLVVAVVSLAILVALNVVLLGTLSWAIPLFAAALKAAVTWIPRLVRWIRALSRLEHRVAGAAPYLIEGETLRIARANRAEVGAIAPWPDLPVEMDRQVPRFFDKLTGGLIPGWAMDKIFPSRSDTGEEASDSQESDVPVGRDRRGRTIYERRRATASESDIGEGVTGTNSHRLGRFQGMLDDLRRNPLPLPMVLTEAFYDEPMHAVAWTSPERMRERFSPPERLFGLPAGHPGLLTLAAARATHPELSRETLDTSTRNLYLVSGWRARLVPVDLEGAWRLEENPTWRSIGDRLDRWLPEDLDRLMQH